MEEKPDAPTRCRPFLVVEAMAELFVPYPSAGRPLLDITERKAAISETPQHDLLLHLNLIEKVKVKSIVKVQVKS